MSLTNVSWFMRPRQCPRVPVHACNLVSCVVHVQFLVLAMQCPCPLFKLCPFLPLSCLSYVLILFLPWHVLSFSVAPWPARSCPWIAFASVPWNFRVPSFPVSWSKPLSSTPRVARAFSHLCGFCSSSPGLPWPCVCPCLVMALHDLSLFSVFCPRMSFLRIS